MMVKKSAKYRFFGGVPKMVKSEWLCSANSTLTPVAFSLPQHLTNPFWPLSKAYMINTLKLTKNDISLFIQFISHLIRSLLLVS